MGYRDERLLYHDSAIFQGNARIISLDLIRSLMCTSYSMNFSYVSQKMKDLTVCPIAKNYQRVIAKTVWLISTARNAIVVIICSVIAYKYNSSESGSPFVLTGPVRSGLPPFGLPPFSTQINNQTLTFTQMCSELGTSIILVPIIAVLGNVAIAKAFVNEGKVDATQELLTLGICNVLGSCASSMPVTGSFSRSAVNHASGVKTPMGGLYTGVLILLALGLFTPYFYYIPKGDKPNALNSLKFSKKLSIRQTNWNGKS